MPPTIGIRTIDSDSRKSKTEPGEMYWKLIAKRPPATATSAAERAWTRSLYFVEFDAERLGGVDVLADRRERRARRALCRIHAASATTATARVTIAA